MRLYDEIIHDILTSLEKQDKHILPVGAAADPVSRDWQDAGKAMMILQSDMAYELGGHNLPAVGNTLVTTGKDFVPEDEIIRKRDWKNSKSICRRSQRILHMRGSHWCVLQRTVSEREIGYTIRSGISDIFVTISIPKGLCCAYRLLMTGRVYAWRQRH